MEVGTYNYISISVNHSLTWLS